MTALLRIVQATVINSITVYGVFGARWTVATAIALYWSENIIAIVLIALRFVLHRAVTHKRGHTRGVLKTFLQTTLIFTIAHGIFLFLILALLFPNIAPAEGFDLATFKFGLMLIGGVMVFSFLIDALLVKQMPFMAIRSMTDSFMPRVLVVHLTIIFGMLAMASAVCRFRRIEIWRRSSLARAEGFPGKTTPLVGLDCAKCRRSAEDARNVAAGT